MLASTSASAPCRAHRHTQAAPQARPPAAAAACLPRHHRRQRTSSRLASTTAAASLDEAAAAAAGVGGGAAPRGGADAVQPPASAAEVQRANAEYVQHCQAEHGRPGLIDFAAGVNGLPKVVLSHPGGARCELYLHGAAVTSWRHSDGREMLHLRERNSFNGRDPISGGIQIAWPQYGAGALPTHGFLQNLHWSVVQSAWQQPEGADGGDEAAAAEGGGGGGAAADSLVGVDCRPTVSLYTDTDEAWCEEWPHRFEALYTVSLMQPDPQLYTNAEMMRAARERDQPQWMQRERETAAAAAARKAAAAAEAAGEDEERPPATPSVLRCMLQVHNCDDKPMTFTTGLRTHFATRDLATHAPFVKTLGLRGKFLLDYARNALQPGMRVEDADNVSFGTGQALERVYVDCQPGGEVLFCPGSPAHFRLDNRAGFSDVGVSHPITAAPEEACRFVVLASARAVRKVTLQPGEVWAGEMVLTAHDRYWDLPAWELERAEGVPVPDSPELMPGFARRRAAAYDIDE